MTIRSVVGNNKKRTLDIVTSQGRYMSFPYTLLEEVSPTAENPIIKVFVDREMGQRGITYVLRNGEEDSVHLDDFLAVNKDPEYLRKQKVYQVTLKARELVRRSRLGKREIARKLNTSPSQLYRLLDTTNYSKSLDKLMELLGVLGYEVDIRVEPSAEGLPHNARLIRDKFTYLDDIEIAATPWRSRFLPMVGGYAYA